MNIEKYYCERFPAKRPSESDEGFEDELSPLPLVLRHEGPNLADDFHYPQSGVSVRTIDYRPLERNTTFPTGGYSTARWFEKKDDGVEQLVHYHINIHPILSRPAYDFINRKLNDSERQQRRQKASALSEHLPFVQICPGNEVSLRSNSNGRYFSLKRGTVNIPHNRIGEVQMLADKRTNPPVLRFSNDVAEVIDDATEEEYRLRVTGALYEVDLVAIKRLLDVPVATGTLNEGILSDIVRLEAELKRK